MGLTKSEAQIMDVLWCTNKPLSKTDILSLAKGKTWKDVSIHVLINGLLQKGLIKEAGIVHRSKNYARTFVPTVTREEYLAKTIFGHQHKLDMVRLIDAMLHQSSITPQQRDQIVVLIQNNTKE